MDKLLKEYINSILSLREGIGQKSLTHGINCTASGTASFASGIGLNAVKDGQTVVGSYNTTDITSFFVVGAGETSVSSANAFAAGRNLTASTIYINQSPIPPKNSYIQIGAVTISEDRAATLNQIEATYEPKLPPTPSNPAQKVLSGNRTWVEMSGAGTDYARLPATEVITGYAKATSVTALVASDTINVALGKLEKGLDAKEPTITAGTTSQYWRGDKSWQTLNKSAVGLGSVDNTADSSKNVLSASKLTTPRAISLTGDVTGSVNFDGAADAPIAATLATVATAGTYKSVTVNAKGLVTSGTNPTTLSGYGITDAQSKVTSITVSLTSIGWSSLQQTVAAAGVTASNIVLIGCDAAEYYLKGVYCYYQSANSLTFRCSVTPTSSLSVKVVIIP